jgi:hypothetical protein
MRKFYKSILIAMVTGLLVGIAAPANAAQVPFSVDLPIPGTGAIGISAMNQGTGFVGACDPVLQCTGASLRVAHTGGDVEVGGVDIELRGVICASDQVLPCGRPGDPGTGVVFTHRNLTLGTTGATVPDFELEYCVWEQDPRFTPGSCTTIYVRTKSLGITPKTETVSLGGLIPERVIVSGISNTL